MGEWTNISVHCLWHPCHWGVCLSQLQFSLAHWWSWHCLIDWDAFPHQPIKWAGCTAQMHCLMMQCLALGWTWGRSHDLPYSCMLCSLISHHATDSIFWSLFGKQFDDLWDTLRGEASVLAEPLEDFCILICPFIPFGTCSWCSQLHTAIVAIWHFILIVSQYVITSWSTECLPEFNFKGMGHAFWCYLLVPQPEIYI